MTYNKPKLKSEFVAELFPDVTEKTARRYLCTEIRTNPQLAAQLTAIGYTNTTKVLSVRMQQIIRAALNA